MWYLVAQVLLTACLFLVKQFYYLPLLMTVVAFALLVLMALGPWNSKIHFPRLAALGVRVLRALRTMTRCVRDRDAVDDEPQSAAGIDESQWATTTVTAAGLAANSASAGGDAQSIDTRAFVPQPLQRNLDGHVVSYLSTTLFEAAALARLAVD